MNHQLRFRICPIENRIRVPTFATCTRFVIANFMVIENRKLLCGVWCTSLLVLTLFASVVGAGRVEYRADKTIIHVSLWQLPSPSETDIYSRTERAVVQEFEQRFPAFFAQRYRDKYKANPDRYGNHNWDNVEIRLSSFSGITVEGVETELIGIAGKVAADVLKLNFSNMDVYVREGFVYPLDKPEDNYLAAMTDAEMEFRVHPKIWPCIRRKGPGGTTQVWALPFGGALSELLLYRKDLFDAAGLPYPDNEWTWDDLFAACRKIADPGHGIYGMLFSRTQREANGWFNFLWSAGGEVMRYDEQKDQWRCVFNTREAALAVDFYTHLIADKWTDANGRIRRGYTSRESSTNQSMVKWERGEIAMRFATLEEKLLARINPDVTGVAPVPLGPTGLRGGKLSSVMMALYAGIEDSVVRDAAWEYIRFYHCRESARIRARVMVENGMGQFVNPKYLELAGYAYIIDRMPRGWADVFAVSQDTGRTAPYGPNSGQVAALMTEPLHEAERLAMAGQLPKDRQDRLDLLQELLNAACAKANKEMFGVVSARQRLLRRVTATAVLSAIVVAFVFTFRRISKVFASPSGADSAGNRWEFRKYAWAYLLLLPAVLTIFIWQYVPLVHGSLMAFQDYKIMGGAKWVWVDNFGDVLWNGAWWTVVWNSLRYSFLVIFLTFLPPVILAILLQEVPHGKIIFRTLYYLPAVISGLVVILLWKSFYEPSEHGVLNAVLMHIPAIGFILVGVVLLLVAFVFSRRLMFHDMIYASLAFATIGLILFYTCASLAQPILFPGNEPLWKTVATFSFNGDTDVAIWRRLFMTLPEPYRWLSDPKTAMIGCVVPMVWAGMGPGCLIYLAALKSVAEEYYEAADVDGATSIDKILFIVFPILKALLIINFVGVFIGSWNATGNILAMTGGTSNTEVAGLHIFYKAFIYLKFGPATAMAWVLGFMLIGFTIHQLRILSRLEFRAADSSE